MVSVVVPFHNEQDSLKDMVSSLHSHLEKTGRPFETILVDDGSTDNSLPVAQGLLESYPGLTLVSLRRRSGKSAALAVGLDNASGETVFTMDADLQDDPAEIPKFLSALEGGLDLVCGWRRPRRDPLFKRLQSLFYKLALRLAGFRVVHDINCGFKAMRREVARDLPLFGERHRLIPLVANWQGFRVGEVIVNHNPRSHGKSKYGASRFPNAIFDFLTALMLSRFYRCLFSVVGVLSALAGLIICGWITCLKVTTGTVGYHYPLLILGVMLLALGVQLVLTSFLSELIIHKRGRPPSEYSVKLVARSPAVRKQPAPGK